MLPAGDRLEATCNFDSSEREAVTMAGATHHHEMCNLYMMMWSELPVFMTCSGAGVHGDQPAINPSGAGAASARCAVRAQGSLAPDSSRAWAESGVGRG